MEMIDVAITGVSGRAGRRLLALLADDDAVARLVGIDLREPAVRPKALEFHALDIGSADLKAVLEDVDVVVHLAAVLDPVPDEQAMARVNVEGTRRVLDAAAATGVSKVVYASSAYVYGAHGDNPIPLTEDVTLRPNAGFTFAVHKAEAERLLAEWADEHPGVVTAVLRPPFVLGGGTPASVRALVRGRRPVRVRGGAPEVQYLHVDDLGSALALAVTGDLAGVYNVAPDGWVAHDEAAALAGWVPRVSVSGDVAERLAARLWTAGIGDVPPGLVALQQYPCVVANSRLAAAGWSPSHTSEEAILAVLEEEGGASNRSNRALKAAVAGGALAAIGTAAWAIIRRRR